ncbi:MAG TPA: hypothetical protein VK829_05795 [Terriglobales bacterium]|jgi:hypothetical protein|nr:hypothetical protein [Terriglobales bacterium]
MRNRINLLFVTLLAVAALAVVPANAVTVKVAAAGSSAQWQATGVAAANAPTLGGVNSHHYTIKGKCPDSSNCGQIFDVRPGVNHADGGSLWVVWNNAQTEVWAYLSVDSIVGVRAFFANPRNQLQIDSNAENSGSAQNLISYALFKYGDTGTCGPNGAQENTCDAPSLPTAIYNALNNASITAGITDIRPEDAKFGAVRVQSALTTNLSGLGYTGTPTGIPVESPFSSSTATPIVFNIYGTDPVTGNAIPPFTVFEAGASPITIIDNRTDPSGLGSGVTDVTQTQLQSLFTGTTCNMTVFGGSASVAVNPVLREPLSGTMNTYEFTNMTSPAGSTAFVNSQETNVGEPTPGTAANPLNMTCVTGPGVRYRGIGTGEIVGAVFNGNGSSFFNGTDAIGYTFFSYGNVSKIAGSASYGYLTLNGVDPLIGQPGYVAGQLPVCALPCPAKPGATFKHLRDGTYRSWSVLRAVSDRSGVNRNNLDALVIAEQNDINKYVPDFVPFRAAAGDPGLKLYRSHSKNAYTVGTASNGLGGQPENGSDVGGCIKKLGPPPGLLNHHENTGGCKL